MIDVQTLMDEASVFSGLKGNELEIAELALLARISLDPSLSADLLSANNLSDLQNAATARTNLGLGTAAVQNVSYFLQTANNLSDLANAGTARTNLGLGTAAVQNTGFFLQTANNLSDVANAATARTNLGLGTGNSPTFTGLTLSGLTSGSVLFAGTAGVLSQDNTNFFWDDSAKTLRIGPNTADTFAGTKYIRVRKAVASATASHNGIYAEINGTGTQDSGRALRGLQTLAQFNDAAGTLASISGVEFWSWLVAGALTSNVTGAVGFGIMQGGSASRVLGVQATAQVTGGTTSTSIAAGNFGATVTAGTHALVCGLLLENTWSGGTITDTYAIKVNTGTAGTVTNRYGIYLTLGHAADIGLTLKQASTPTVNVFQVLNSSDVAQAALTSANVFQAQGIQVMSTGSIAFSSGAIGASSDVIFVRDGAAAAHLRNGATAQAFRVAGSYTDASNYVSLEMNGTSSGSNPALKVKATGTFVAGGYALVLDNDSTGGIFFRTQASNRWIIQNAGHFVANNDNTYDIGASGSTRPRTGYFGTGIVCPVISTDATKLGFFGVTTVVRATALTQTYSTAERTLANNTSSDMATTAATNVAPFGFSTQAQADAIATKFNLLRTDLDDLKQFVNAAVDDLQAYGLLQ
jgi:hypothetical protein